MDRVMHAVGRVLPFTVAGEAALALDAARLPAAGPSDPHAMYLAAERAMCRNDTKELMLMLANMMALSQAHESLRHAFATLCCRAVMSGHLETAKLLEYTVPPRDMLQYLEEGPGRVTIPYAASRGHPECAAFLEEIVQKYRAACL